MLRMLWKEPNAKWTGHTDPDSLERGHPSEPLERRQHLQEAQDMELADLVPDVLCDLEQIYLTILGLRFCICKTGQYLFPLITYG